MMKRLLISLIISGYASVATAQTASDSSYTKPEKSEVKTVPNPMAKKNFRVLSLGLDVGGTLFWGDTKSWNTSSPDAVREQGGWLGFGINGYLTYWINPVIGVQGQLSYMQWNSRNRNYFAQTRPYYETALNLNLNMVPWFINGYDGGTQRKWNFIPFAGVGMAYTGFNLYDAGGNLVVETPEGDTWLGFGKRLYRDWFFQGGFNLKYRIATNWDIDARAIGKMWAGDLFEGLIDGDATDAGFLLTFGTTYYIGGKDKTPILWEQPLDDMYADMQKVKEDIAALSTDDDGDGVSNKFDEDNTTPAGIAVDGHGNPLDVDADGVADYQDDQPFSNKGVAVNEKGVEADDDNDGVPNSEDWEAGTKDSSLVDVRGRAIGGAGAGGGYFPSVLFANNSAEISSATETSLLNFAKVMHANPDLKVELVGHASKTGSEEFNMKLAKRRAEAVKNVLVNEYGIDGSRITTTSKGKGEPFAKKSAGNRRVDFVIK
jgi:outer membrane protein OmpA-like peptidoglycan-associated protein